MKCKERGEARLPHERGAEGFLREPARSEEKDTPNLHNLLGFLRGLGVYIKGNSHGKRQTRWSLSLPPAAQIQVSEIA